jgi:hypothetical protein
MKLFYLPIVFIVLLFSCSKKGQTPTPVNTNNTTNSLPPYYSGKALSVDEDSSVTINLKSIIISSVPYTVTNYTVKHGNITSTDSSLTYTPNTGYSGNDTLTLTISYEGKTTSITTDILVSYYIPPTYFTIVYNGVSYTKNFPTGEYGFGLLLLTTPVDTMTGYDFYFFNKETGDLFTNGEIPLAIVKSFVGNKYLVNSGTGTNPTLITSDYSFSISLGNSNSIIGNSQTTTSTTTVRYPDTSQYYLQIDSFDETTNLIKGHFVCQLTNGVTITGNFAQIVAVI